MSERYITKVEYSNGSVTVHLDNGDTMGLLTHLYADQSNNSYSEIEIKAYMVKSE